MTFAELMNNNYTLFQYGEMILRLLAACLCGAIIGFERTKRNKEAGIRTHVIVSCAAALIMLVSKYGFADLVNESGSILGSRGADPARIAAQAITGVSFIGAGVIFHNGNAVKGLTTAAGLWATAAIGLTIGSGLYILGAAATIIIAIIQFVMHKIAIGPDGLFTSKIKFSVKNSDEFRSSFREYIESIHATVIESSIKFDSEGFVIYNLTIRTPNEVTIEELSSFLESKSTVKNVSCVNV